MAFLNWLTHNWFTFLQSAGIIGSLVFTAMALLIDAKERRISNLFVLTKQHRDIWTQLYRRPDLARVLDPDPDLQSEPVTDEEEIFVSLLILHLSSAHAAMRVDMFKRPEGIEADIQEFFSYPIPRKIWDKLRLLQEDEFVAFVEKALTRTGSDRQHGRKTARR